jgi:hypothetical protein
MAQDAVKKQSIWLDAVFLLMIVVSVVGLLYEMFLH